MANINSNNQFIANYNAELFNDGHFSKEITRQAVTTINNLIQAGQPLDINDNFIANCVKINNVVKVFIQNSSLSFLPKESMIQHLAKPTNERIVKMIQENLTKQGLPNNLIDIVALQTLRSNAAPKPVQASVELRPQPVQQNAPVAKTQSLFSAFNNQAYSVKDFTIEKALEIAAYLNRQISRGLFIALTPQFYQNCATINEVLTTSNLEAEAFIRSVVNRQTIAKRKATFEQQEALMNVFKLPPAEQASAKAKIMQEIAESGELTSTVYNKEFGVVGLDNIDTVVVNMAKNPEKCSKPVLMEVEGNFRKLTGRNLPTFIQPKQLIDIDGLRYNSDRANPFLLHIE